MKLNRLKIVLFTIAIIIATISAAVYSVSTTTVLAQGRPDNPSGGTGGGGGGDNGGGDGGSGTRYGEIRGVVTNLTTGQPAGGIDVSVNGGIVRTDSDGKYSVTGLNAGNYTVNLVLDGFGTAAQGPQVVNLPSGGLAIVDLQFLVGQPLPTPTVVVPEVPVTESPAELPDAGGIAPDNSFIPFRNFAIITSNAQAILPLSEAQNVVSPVLSGGFLPVPLCDTVYTVQSGDLLNNVLEDTSDYSRVVEATNMLRVESRSFANVTTPDLLIPGTQLCIPAN